MQRVKYKIFKTLSSLQVHYKYMYIVLDMIQDILVPCEKYIAQIVFGD